VSVSINLFAARACAVRAARSPMKSPRPQRARIPADRSPAAEAFRSNGMSQSGSCFFVEDVDTASL